MKGNLRLAHALFSCRALAIQKGSFRAIYMHKDFLLTISNMLILPPALKIFKKKILGGVGAKRSLVKNSFLTTM